MDSNNYASEPPFWPSDPVEYERWEHTRKRRRLLEGRWERDLFEHLRQHLNATGLNNLGRPAQAINLFSSVVRQIAVTYDRAPDVKFDGDVPDDAQEALDDLLQRSKWSTVAQRNNEYVVGYRESLVNIQWSAAKNRITLRLVSPDVVQVKCDPLDPSVVVEVREARVRKVRENGKVQRRTYWDVWSIEDGIGYFRIEDDDGVDVTLKFPDTQVPETYPYIDEVGKPFLPWTVYHACDVTEAWDPFTWCELVEATYDVAVLWSLFFHCCRDASWAQKYVFDADLDGVSVVNLGSQMAGQIETRPTSVLVFNSKGERSGNAGTFQAPIEPTKFAEAVLQYQRTVLANLNIHPADIERTSGAESGYAIQLKRSAQRRLAARFEPQFREGDGDLIHKMIRVSNLFGGSKLPVAPVSITYHPIDISPEERDADFDYNEKLVGADLLDRVSWYQRLNPGVSEEESTIALLRNSAINKAITTGGMVVSPDTADRIVNARSTIESVLTAARAGGTLDEAGFVDLLSKVSGMLSVGLDAAPDPREAMPAILRPDMPMAADMSNAPAADMSNAPPAAPELGTPTPADAPALDTAAPAPAPVPGGTAVADTALNGAQVSSLLEVITSVAERRLPRVSAVAIIERAFNVPTDVADRMLGPVGESFFAEPAAPAPSNPPAETPAPKPTEGV